MPKTSHITNVRTGNLRGAGHRGTRGAELTFKKKRTRSGRQELKNIDGTIVAQYTDHVTIVVDTDRVLAKLNELLAETGLKAVPLKRVRRLLEECSVSNNSRSTSPRFRDEETGLLIPPTAALEQYSKHWERLPERLSPEAFLREFWSDYVTKFGPWLYAGHLRLLDESLLGALKLRADARNESPDDYLLQNGVLTRKHIFQSNPPTIYARQADLYRRMVLATRATATLKAASDELFPGQQT